MENLVPFIDQHGYWLLAAVGFVEFIGLPIASMPVLVVAGAAAAMGTMHPVPAALAAALGGVAADAAWFAIARHRGEPLVGQVCALTSNPTACVHRVTERIARIGPAFILPSKFVPGTGNLIAAAAGLARVRWRTFVVLDLIALVLWAGVYIAVGWVFAARIEQAVALTVQFGRVLVAVAAAAVVAAAVLRARRVWAHRLAHARFADAVTPVSIPAHSPRPPAPPRRAET